MSKRGSPYRLIVLRHGQSEWNAAGLFTGWENAHLVPSHHVRRIR
jgi:2,3-bisphosphoglycerate-dependent phosphoglycerate mutase